ncbi:hypothetical protein BJ166DRAFT_615088 [Pestalotiopsis sp. NC0098]|nr:hypothetical protein BJ166DRAFT_615088 [Pestalotiopsis sp. NC0098]
MPQRSNSQCFAISPLDLGSLDLRESEYFLPSPVQETSASFNHESFAGQVSASSSQQPENNLVDQPSAETEHDSDESLHLVALFQSTSGSQSHDDDLPGELNGGWRPSFLTRINISIWDCVDYEAKAITPWLRKPKVKDQPLEHLTLDYVSMNTLVVPFRSLARRDFLVAICAVVSLSFKILIVLSSSLITLTYTTVTQPVFLGTRFVDDPSRLSTTELNPLLYVIGRELYGLPWPRGTSEEFIYQSIRLPFANITGFRTMVEGLSFGLDCQAATASSLVSNDTLNIEISSPDCDSNISFRYSVQESDLWTVLGPVPTGFGFLAAVQCTNHLPSRTEGRRLAWIFGAVESTTSLPVDNFSADTWTVSRLQILVYNPSYNISDVMLAGQDNDLLQISLAENSHNRSFDHVNAWDITTSILDAHSSESHSFFVPAIVVGKDTDTDSLISIATVDTITSIIATLNLATFQQPIASYSTDLLTSALQRYYRLYATFLVYDALLEPATASTAGTVSFKQQRLIVQTATCQAMVGLCISLVIGLLAISLMASQVANFSGDPGTVIGIATLMVPDITQFPRGYGALGHASLKEALLCNSDSEFRVRQEKPRTTEKDHRVSQFHRPTVLKSSSRGSMFTLVGGILISLEVLLRHFDANEGIGIIGDQAYIHYLWTALPAIVLTLIGLYFGSVDSELKSLSSIETLSRKATSGDASLNLRLLGRLYPHTVWKEFRNHKLAAAFATTCSLVASLLTVTTGSLFFEVVIPSNFQAHLNMTDTFSSDYNVYTHPDGSRPSDFNSSILPSLLLGTNLSYPGNTYEGLIFPAIQWSSQPNISKDQDVRSTFDIKAVLPAIQSRLICRKYSQSDINASMIYKPRESHLGDENTTDSLENSFSQPGARVLVNITDEFCHDNPYAFQHPFAGAISGAIYLGDEAPSRGIFATSEAVKTDDIVLESKCSDFFVFVWGSFESDSVSASAAICKTTLETVYADVVLFAHDLSIDPTSKPSARQGTRQKALPKHTGSFNGLFFASYTELADKKTVSSDMLQGHSTFLDNFFYLLTTSRNALPLDSLTNLDEEDAVIAAMSLQHSIIAAHHGRRLFQCPETRCYEHYSYAGLGRATCRNTTPGTSRMGFCAQDGYQSAPSN